MIPEQHGATCLVSTKADPGGCGPRCVWILLLLLLLLLICLNHDTFCLSTSLHPPRICMHWVT